LLFLNTLIKKKNIFLIFTKVTYPLDITKTRLQLQNEMMLKSSAVKTKKIGMTMTAYNIGLTLIKQNLKMKF